jgi:hypothetical protein
LFGSLSQRHRRNELFGINNIRGNYPQFFLIAGDIINTTTLFLGSFSYIEAMDDVKTLTRQALGLDDDDDDNEDTKQTAPDDESAVVLVTDSDDEDEFPAFCCGFLPKWLSNLAKPNLFQDVGLEGGG